MSTAPAPSPSPTPMRANRKTIETTCSICDRGFELAEMVYRCANCGGYHHTKCWDTHRSCTRAEEFVSVRHPEMAAPCSQAIASPPLLPDAQSEERACPVCGELIKREAIKCRFCNAVLDERLDRLEANPAYVKPPKLHWAVLLLLHICTCYTFGLCWLIRQSVWAQKADRESKAMLPTVAGAALSIIYIIYVWTAPIGDHKDKPSLLPLVAIVIFQIGNFRIKRAMETYYNSVEPVNLQLSGPMTFFFSFLYFQYHFRRIAKERESRSLRGPIKMSVETLPWLR